MRNIVSYICHNVNLPVLPWKNDYFVIIDHFHFPRFLLVEKKITNKAFQIVRWRRSLCCYINNSYQTRLILNFITTFSTKLKLTLNPEGALFVFDFCRIFSQLPYLFKLFIYTFQASPHPKLQRIWLKTNWYCTCRNKRKAVGVYAEKRSKIQNKIKIYNAESIRIQNS